MIKRADLIKLADLRREEAKVLHDHGYYDGAVYIAQYVVEMGLKACICKHLRMREYPGDKSDQFRGVFATHELALLLQLSGLSNQVSIANTRQPNLFANWSVLEVLSVENRYKPAGTTTMAQSQRVITALEEPVSGFFTWMKTKW